MTSKEATLTVAQALEAAEYARETIDGCENMEDLDEASNADTFEKGCPDTFTEAQIDLAHELVLNAYLKSIGRA